MPKIAKTRLTQDDLEAAWESRSEKSLSAILQWVQPVWLQLSRDRKSLKWHENVQVRGIETGPVAHLRRHYSPSGAERGCSRDCILTAE